MVHLVYTEKVRPVGPAKIEGRWCTSCERVARIAFCVRAVRTAYVRLFPYIEGQFWQKQ